MPLVSPHKEAVDLLPVLSQVKHLVFDLNSLAGLKSQETMELVKQILQIFWERDFQLTLLWNQHPPPEWQNRKQITVIQGEKDNLSLLWKNPVLFSPDCFWITDNPKIQQHLAQQKLWFAHRSPLRKGVSGIYFKAFPELLELFNPSRHTALLLSEKILTLKNQAPQQPLIIGIGGPEECGHTYFVEELVDELEKHPYLVEGIDLTELVSAEFYQQDYWRSAEIQHWMLQELLVPFSQGKRICLEAPPPLMEPYETNVYPFFLAPEMILLVWGNTLFLESLQTIIHWGILLELSPKVATARLFGMDERENFDPAFIEKYEENDGRLYADYLKKHKVRERVEQRVDFNNFRAFRLQP